MGNLYRACLENSSAGDVILDSLTIASMPSRTIYIVGETLDTTGLVVTATSGTLSGDVTAHCAITPSVFSDVGTQTVTINYGNLATTFSVSVIFVNSIEITTPPTRSIYFLNDTLDLTGIVVTAHTGSSDVDITSICTFSPANGTVLDSYGNFAITAYCGSFSDSIYGEVVEIGSLEATSWSGIKAVGALGRGSQYWSVGDSKTITLNGKIGTLTFTNYTVKVFIIHFNYRGDNGIYFQGFKSTSNIDVALCDSKYDKTSTQGYKYYNLNHWGNYNYGGWKGCDLRYDILGSTNVAPSGYGSSPNSSRTGYDATESAKTNPRANTLMSAIPSDLRDALALWTVYTDNVAGKKGQVAANVTASVDYFVLLSDYEFGHTNSGANTTERSYQSIMSYYNGSNSSKIKKKHSDTSKSVFQWKRSPEVSSISTFCLTQTNGTSVTYYASGSGGLAPAFRVA